MDHSDLVRVFGSAARAAEKLGFSPAVISIWKTRGIPIGRQYQIQVKTRGRLRADIA